ncbi:MAG: hypothetical protein OES79_02895, partial [Planctomycetota bacterium]|nr:hypothetical protein [Planctomycetota bacterium]
MSTFAVTRMVCVLRSLDNRSSIDYIRSTRGEPVDRKFAPRAGFPDLAKTLFTLHANENAHCPAAKRDCRRLPA